MLSKFFKLHFDLIFFYLFLFTSSFQKRHIFNLDQAKVNNVFNEWQAISLYLADIFFIFCLIFWLINLKENLKNIKIYKIILITLAIFLVIVIAGTIFNASHYLNQNIEIYKIVKLLEFSLIFIITITKLNTSKRIITAMSVLIASGVVQSIIAILQYLKQQSLMLKALGEPLILSILPNVAKIVIDKERVLIRAYGTFPHPNVLAGFLIVTMIFTLAIIIYKLSNNGLDKPNNRILTISLVFVLALQIFALVFTFSRTAWLAFLISVIALIIFSKQDIVKSFKNIASNKFYYPFILAFLAVILLIITQWQPITARSQIKDTNGDMAVSNRAFYNQISFNIIKKSPLIGIGYGSFTNQMQNFTDKKIDWWQYQPAHNIFLLILAETGILGLLSFLGFLLVICYQIIFNRRRDAGVSPSENNYFQKTAFSIFIAFLFIALFDHYLWTIHQGQILFWFVLGLMAVQYKK